MTSSLSMPLAIKDLYPEEPSLFQKPQKNSFLAGRPVKTDLLQSALNGLEESLSISFTQTPFVSSLLTELSKQATQQKINRETDSLAKAIQGTPSSSDVTRAQSIYQKARKECEENKQCKSLKHFVDAFSTSPSHQPIREKLGTSVYEQVIVGPKFSGNPWLSDTDPSRTRFVHTTSLEGLKGILELGRIEPRAENNTLETGNEKAIYLASNRFSSQYGQYSLVLKTSAFLDKSKEEISFVADKGDYDMIYVGIRTPIEISPDTLECIVILKGSMTQQEFEATQKTIQTLTHFKIPIKDLNKLRDMREAGSQGVPFPKHLHETILTAYDDSYEEDQERHFLAMRQRVIYSSTPSTNIDRLIPKRTVDTRWSLENPDSKAVRLRGEDWILHLETMGEANREIISHVRETVKTFKITKDSDLHNFDKVVIDKVYEIKERTFKDPAILASLCISDQDSSKTPIELLMT